MPALCGNCPAVASWPPNIFGEIIAFGAASETQMTPTIIHRRLGLMLRCYTEGFQSHIESNVNSCTPQIFH
jgi:hypothetical protein